MDGFDPDSIVVPKVAVDRYRKRIKSEDIYRGQANYAKAAAAGALAGLAARLKQMPLRHRAAAGAAAGLVAEGLVRAAGRSTKDSYGERSHTAKVSEQLPAALGLTLAGTLGYHRLKRAAKEFSAATASSGEATGRGATKSEAHADATGKIPDNAVAGKATYMQSGVEWLCFLQWKQERGFVRRFPRSQFSQINLRKSAKSADEIQFSIPVRLRAKLIQAAALAGGITAADAATRTAFPGDDETRKKAAFHGATQGALYGSVLAGSEPVLRKIAMKFHARRTHKQIFEFRAMPTADADDLSRQRRKLALYAGGAVLGAGALAVLARSGGKAGLATAGKAVIKPQGRGTLERLASANALRQERGYVHLKPMMPGQRKRFDKLPAGIQAKTGKFAGLAVNPNLSPGEKQKFRKAVGKIRGEHKFETQFARFTGKGLRPPNPLGRNYSEGIRRALKNLGASVPETTDAQWEETKRLAREAMKGKKLGLERRMHNAIEFKFNLTPAHLNAPESDDTLRNPFYKKPTLKRAITAPGFKDLVKPRFKMRTVKISDLTSHQPLLEKEKVDKFTGRKTNGPLPIVHDTGDNWHIQDGNHRLAVLKNIGRKTAKVKVIQTALERRHNAVEFGSASPQRLARKAYAIFGKRRAVIGGDPLFETASAGMSKDAKAAFAAVRGQMVWKKRAAMIRASIKVPDSRDLVMPVPTTPPTYMRKVEEQHGRFWRHGVLGKKLTPIGFERRLRNALEFAIHDSRFTEFMYAADASAPLPDWVQTRRKNEKRRENIHTAADVAGIAGGSAVIADVVHKLITRKKAVESLKDHLKNVGLTDARIVTFFKRREQLREGGKSEAEKGSGRFVDPISVAAGLRPAYSVSTGGERRFYGGAHGGDLAITHAQVLRSAYTHGGAIRKYAHRTGNLVRDTADVAAGNPRRTDAYGRPQRREWEKPWFGRAVKDVAIGGAVLGGALALKKSPALRGHVMAAGAEIRRKVNRMVPDFFANWGPRLKIQNFNQESRKAGKNYEGEGILHGALAGLPLGAIAGVKSDAAHERALVKYVTEKYGGHLNASIVPRFNKKLGRVLGGVAGAIGGIAVGATAGGFIGKRIPRKPKQTEFASVPFKFGGKIDYARQDAMYNWAKHLRREVRRKAGLPLRPAIAGSIPAKPSSVIRGFVRRFPSSRFSQINFFDDVANWAGWDVRDPRGRSARVFAPGGRKRMRREKDWHERVDVQRKLLGALAAVGTVVGAGAGLAIGRKIYRPKAGLGSKIVTGPWMGAGHPA